MDYINKLKNFNPSTVSNEPKPSSPPPPTQPAINGGIAKTADGFENAGLPKDSLGILQQKPATAPATELVIPRDLTADGAQLFNRTVIPPLQPGVAPPPKPSAEMLPIPQTAPKESALGKTLEDFTKKKIEDLYKKKTTKEYGPDPDKTTASKSKDYGSNVGMPENLSTLGNGGGTTIGELQGSWNLFEFGKVDEKTEGKAGKAYVKGSTHLVGLSGQLYYNADVDFDKFTLKGGVGAKGSVEIIGAHYEAGYDSPDLEIGQSKVDLNAKTNADAYAGVKGNVEANITLGKENNLSLGAGAFDGANASLSAKIGAGDVADTHGYLAAWAGVGAKAKFDAGFKDGKLNVDWGLGLAIGAGAEWDLGVSVDFGKAIKTGLDGMREIGLKKPADWIENTANDGLNFVGDAAKWTGGALETAGKAIGDAASSGAKWTVKEAEDIAKQAEEAAKKAAEAAAKAAAKAAEEAAEAAKNAAEEAVDAVKDVAEGAYNAGKKVVNAVTSLFDDWP